MRITVLPAVCLCCWIYPAYLWSWIRVCSSTLFDRWHSLCTKR